MCGIGGAIHLRGERIPHLENTLGVMNRLLAHRGPDGEGTWVHEGGHVGFAHRRLSIIDVEGGAQPMADESSNWITYNGEIYNYPELRDVLGVSAFRTKSDTEVALRAYGQWGPACLDRLRGMFAFALWDEDAGALFCARDRFGIKPLYYAVAGDILYFASEAKVLLPFLERVDVDRDGLLDYLTFQFCLPGRTMFEGIEELPGGHCLTVSGGLPRVKRYWEVYYDLDFDHTERYFAERVEALLEESVALHLRSDVPVSTYLSGGTDSSAVACLARAHQSGPMDAFTGKFAGGDPRYDESRYARLAAEAADLTLHEVEIDAADFIDCIGDVIYHLDYPVAGPGSFPQYVVSREAGRHAKVILGGQGGDEIFGGYARYLVAYFEQCIKAAINGTMNRGNFVVTYESIIPNLTALQGYEPMLQSFWRDGLFDELDARYYRLIDRAPDLGEEVNWAALPDRSPFGAFCRIFHGKNVGHESYFDKMTHFDFKTLLPALLHVEDRMSMAHGLESRVPLLDHELVELAATIPADSKFRDGRLKHILKRAIESVVPAPIVQRQDKMGFPVPLSSWLTGELADYVHDVLGSRSALGRDLINNAKVLEGLNREPAFGRKIWGLLCLELWQQQFIDQLPEATAAATHTTTEEQSS
jgi:asparagine synthase (glutamine-hydrolysing)